MANIITKIESARGCGYRKEGGLYLVADGIGRPCCKLPHPLTVCPCCHAGIKPSRGWTWVSSNLFAEKECTEGRPSCPMNMTDTMVGLMWVGEKFYPTAEHFAREAQGMGVSKRISQVPKDLVVGETWCYLAHRKAISVVNEKGEIDFAPGVFQAFRPTRIEYVVRGSESAEELEALEKRGLTLVRVIRDIDTQGSLLDDFKN